MGRQVPWLPGCVAALGKARSRARAAGASAGRFWRRSWRACGGAAETQGRAAGLGPELVSERRAAARGARPPPQDHFGRCWADRAEGVGRRGDPRLFRVRSLALSAWPPALSLGFSGRFPQLGACRWGPGRPPPLSSFLPLPEASDLSFPSALLSKSPLLAPSTGPHSPVRAGHRDLNPDTPFTQSSITSINPFV